MGGGGKYLILKMRHLKFKFSPPLSKIILYNVCYVICIKGGQVIENN